MASLCGKEPLILETLKALRQQTPLPITSFTAYTNLLGTNVPAADFQRFTNTFKDTPERMISGLQKAAAQSSRWAYSVRQAQAAQPQQVAPTPQSHFLQMGAQHRQDDLNNKSSQEGHKYFFEKLCPFIIDRALEFPQVFPEGVVKLPIGEFNPKISRRTEIKIDLSRRQILTIHALAFLGFDPTFEKVRNDVGSISWWTVFWNGSSRVAVERIICQLAYFDYWRMRFELTAASSAVDKSSKSENNNNAKNDDDSEASSTSNKQQKFYPLLDEIVSYTRVSYPEEGSPYAEKNKTEKTDKTVDSDDGAANNNNNDPLSIPDWLNREDPRIANTLLLKAPKPNERFSHNPGNVIPKYGIHVEAQFLEDFPEATTHVDFANKSLMIHRIIPSATQEEIMFSVRPECFIALPLFNTLREHEAVIIRNARIYETYRGYADSFTFSNFEPSLLLDHASPSSTIEAARKTSGGKIPCPEVIAIDAHVNLSGNPRRQFTNEFSIRDLDKTWIGFQGVAESQQERVIGTGPFGCGAFNGNVFLKFLQQLMAAATCSPRKYLAYYDRKPEVLQLMSKLILVKKIKVGQAQAFIELYAGGADGVSNSATRDERASDLAPTIQGGVRLNANIKTLDEKISSSTEESVESLEEQGREMIKQGLVEKGTFAMFLMKQLIEAKVPNVGG
jgi:hypothetical protein